MWLSGKSVACISGMLGGGSDDADTRQPLPIMSGSAKWSADVRSGALWYMLSADAGLLPAEEDAQSIAGNGGSAAGSSLASSFCDGRLRPKLKPNIATLVGHLQSGAKHHDAPEPQSDTDELQPLRQSQRPFTVRSLHQHWASWGTTRD